MRRLRMTSGFASKLKNALVCHSGAPAGRPVRRLPGYGAKNVGPVSQKEDGSGGGWFLGRPASSGV